MNLIHAVYPASTRFSRLLFCMLGIIVLSGPFVTPLSAEEVTEKQLEEAATSIKRGIELYQESDFNNAITQLQDGLAILEKSINQMKAAKELIDAHLHLGLAFIGVDKIDDAKNQFKEVVTIDPKFTLDAGAYSQKVTALFNEAKAEHLSEIMENQSTKKQDAVSTPPANEEEQQIKKPFYKKWWFWTAAGVGAVGIAAAAAAKKEEETPVDEGLLFSDDFDDGDSSGWVATVGGSFWAVQNNQLTHIEHEEPWDVDRIESGDVNWRAGWISARIGDFQGDLGDYEAIIYFAFRNLDNTAYLSFNYGSLCLHRYIDGGEVFVETIEYPLELGRYYQVDIEITQAVINIYIDDSRVMSHVALSPLVGRIALGATSPTPIRFDDIQVYDFDDSSAARIQHRKESIREPVKRNQRLPLVTPRHVTEKAAR